MRRQRLERGQRHPVVGRIAIAVARAIPLLLGQAGLEREDAIGGAAWIALAGEGEQLRDVIRVGLSDPGELVVRSEVVVAVRHVQARLGNRHRVLIGILRILPDDNRHRHGDAGCGRVQERRRQIGHAGDRVHGGQLPRDRLHAQ